MRELLEKKGQKNEYGRHLEFLRKKNILIKLGIQATLFLFFSSPKSIKTHNLIGQKS
jgi:hypothetical protein